LVRSGSAASDEPLRSRLASIFEFEGPSYKSILPVVFLYFACLFGVAPLTTQIHIDQACLELDAADCSSSEVSAKASTINLAAALVLNLTAILCVGTYGQVADKWGRKPVIAVPCVGLMFFTSGYWYVTTFNPAFYLPVILASSCALGLSGSYVTFIMGALCYASDATAAVPDERKHAYSYTEATIFAPQVIAPVLSGLWAASFGYSLPLIVAMCTMLVTLVYIWHMPESLHPKAPSRSVPLRVNPLQTFINMTYMFTYRTEEGRSPLPMVSLAFLSFFTAAMGATAVQIVYVKHKFGWNSAVIGIYDGTQGLIVTGSMAFAPAVFARVFKTQLRLITWIQLGYFCRMVFYVMFGLSQSTLQLFLCLLLLLLSGPLAPYTRTILSNTVPASDQARIFSAFSAVEGLGALLGPLYSAVYTVFVKQGTPSLVYAIMALMTALSFLMIGYVRYEHTLNMNLPADIVEKRNYASAEDCQAFRHLSVTSADGCAEDGDDNTVTCRLLAEERLNLLETSAGSA